MRKSALGMPFLSAGCLLVVMALAACSTITLTGTPITVKKPKGFVAADEGEVTTYPHRPERHFHLPPLRNGATPTYPEIHIEQLAGDDGSMSLDSYVDKVIGPPPYHSSPFPPKAMAIDGVPGIEFAKGTQMIFDMEGGRNAAYGNMVRYEIVFQYEGTDYHCAMTVGKGDDTQYLQVFEDFCSSVRFSKE